MEYYSNCNIIVIAILGLIKLLAEHFGKKIDEVQDCQNVIDSKPIKHWAIFMIASSVLLAFYDGISGAGGGTLQILAFAMIFRIGMKNILILSAIFSAISLCSAGVNFYFLGLLDKTLMMTMIPAAFIAGFTASYCIQFIKEKHLRLAFIIVLITLLLYLILENII